MFKLSAVFLSAFIMLLITSTAFSAKVDPTRPFGHKSSVTTTPEGKKMVLESIIQSEGVSTVVISGKVLKIFDYFGEYQLTAIHEQSVILRSKTERIELNIFKNNVVKVKVVK